MLRELHGVLPIVHTPFLESGEIDAESLRREIDWAFTQGADGVGTGMVSEILRLTSDERIRLTEQMTRITAGRGSTFAAVTAESAEQAISLAKAAEKAGCDAIMAAPPVATRLSVDAMLGFFSRLADAASLPLIVQDASGYIGQTIPLLVYVELLERYGPAKVLFKPEAAPIGPNLSALRDVTGGAARIFEGSGGILLVDSYRRGVVGTMPGMDLLDGIVALWKALQRGDEDGIYRLHFPICSIVALQMQAGLDGFLATEKHILVRRGIFKSDRRRQPYSWELDSETKAEVERLLGHLDQALRSLQS